GQLLAVYSAYTIAGSSATSHLYASTSTTGTTWTTPVAVMPERTDNATTFPANIAGSYPTFRAVQDAKGNLGVFAIAAYGAGTVAVVAAKSADAVNWQPGGILSSATNHPTRFRMLQAVASAKDVKVFWQSTDQAGDLHYNYRSTADLNGTWSANAEVAPTNTHVTEYAFGANARGDIAVAYRVGQAASFSLRRLAAGTNSWSAANALNFGVNRTNTLRLSINSRLEVAALALTTDADFNNNIEAIQTTQVGTPANRKVIEEVAAINGLVFFVNMDDYGRWNILYDSNQEDALEVDNQIYVTSSLTERHGTLNFLSAPALMTPDTDVVREAAITIDARLNLYVFYSHYTDTAATAGAARIIQTIAPSITGQATLRPTASAIAQRTNLTITVAKATGGEPAITTTKIQWFRCKAKVSKVGSKVPSGCTAITGATKTSYRTSALDKGKYVLAAVTLSHPAITVTQTTISSGKGK
ncbi:MAG: Ig domain of plant-specific actin-binding protein, partial [Actinomycetota bacterium]